MAENNSSAPLKTAEGAYTALPEPATWLVVRGAFRASPHGQDAESNEWLEEAHEPGEKGSFAVYTEQQLKDFADATHAVRLKCKSEQKRLATLWGFQAAPAAVAASASLADIWERSASDQAGNRDGAGEDYNQGVVEGMRICAADLRAALAATPALPATEDSSAGDLAEGQAATLQEIAIEELCQLGYTFKDGRLIPPDHIGELMAVVQASACGCQYGTCETKANRACRMTAEVAAMAAAQEGAGTVTDITDAGFPRVNHVAVAWLERDDGAIFDPRGVREKHLAQRAQQREGQ